MRQIEKDLLDASKDGDLKMMKEAIERVLLLTPKIKCCNLEFWSL
jgi:hypothetical protein